MMAVCASADALPMHVPVLLREVVEAVAPRDGGIYVDGTFGAGGYTSALLNAADCKVVAIDRDPQAISAGRYLEERFGGRLMLIEGRFGELLHHLSLRGITAVDGVVLDVGVSSMQLGTPERGFSFALDGPLDMRMDGMNGAESAADVVNTFPEQALARIIAVYGEENRARPIARAIVAARKLAPITRTLELSEVVMRAAGAGARRQAIHPATRTFQALRIHVNDELMELARVLHAAEHLLRAGGHLAVVSFHSLEDRIVKRFFALRGGRAPGVSRHLPQNAAPLPSFEVVSRTPRRPSQKEIEHNPRARSARLRAGRRTSAPAFDFDPAALGVVLGHA
jgi:16S rRNA (cytosine1402-N4)-methyltransferase